VPVCKGTCRLLATLHGFYPGPLACPTLLSSASHPGATKRRLLIFAALFLAALCALAVSLEASAPAKTPQEKYDATKEKLEGVQEDQSSLAATLEEQNRAIDSMIGEVSALRLEQAAVEAELAEKQSELEAATAALEAEEEHLEEVRAQLTKVLGVLRERLVAIYESGSPSVVNAILESEDWSEMSAQTEYLNRIQSYDDSVVERVKTLRNEVTDAVDRLTDNRDKVEQARDSVAAIEAEVAAARAAAESRFAELQEAQAQRREAMAGLESQEEALNDNLASISSQIAAEGETMPAGAMVPAPLNPGETAGFISESQASAPASAPPEVQAAISAANSIATTPYIWGGGHGSFESSGYDCSGAVSFALHGGGLLESPLDSTGLETWGEPGAGKWITVYANATHAWMIIAGLAFDTVGGPGPRWHSSPVSSPEGFIVRHPPGL
jgi:peptidoglycan hydrolase CwlO-like protein